MFKERLKIVGKTISELFVPTFWVSLVITFFVGLGYLIHNYSLAETIVFYSVLILYLIAMFYIVVKLLVGIFKFVNWLFIETYKARKKTKKNDMEEM